MAKVAKGNTKTGYESPRLPDGGAIRAYNRAEAQRAKDPLLTTRKLVTNVGPVKEAYFSSAGSKLRRASNLRVDKAPGAWGLWHTDFSNNAMTAVDEANALWASASGKGMICSYKAPAGLTSNIDPGYYKGAEIAAALDAKVRYGFSFHYNPTGVTMSYSGAPKIDLGFWSSGRDQVNPIGETALGAGATITLNIMLNRIHDFKYFTKDGNLKAGYTTSIFSGRKPANEGELKDIFNKGTMYDLEFLLRACVGVGISSGLGRNMSWDKRTSDIGWLAGKPVELHLGKSLRYLGQISGLQVAHQFFNERMVPTFSYVGITFTRVPDLPASEINAELYPPAPEPEPSIIFTNDTFGGGAGSGIVVDGKPWWEDPKLKSDFNNLFGG